MRAKPWLAPRFRFEDEDPVRRDHHVIDVQALTDQVVKDPRPVRPEVLQELPHNPLAIPP